MKGNKYEKKSQLIRTWIYFWDTILVFIQFYLFAKKEDLTYLEKKRYGFRRIYPKVYDLKINILNYCLSGILDGRFRKEYKNR